MVIPIARMIARYGHTVWYERRVKPELISLVLPDHMPSLIAANSLAPPSFTHRYATLEPIHIRTHQHATTARLAPTSMTTPLTHPSTSVRTTARCARHQRTAHRPVRRASRLVSLAVSWGSRTHHKPHQHHQPTNPTNSTSFTNPTNTTNPTNPTRRRSIFSAASSRAKSGWAMTRSTECPSSCAR